MPEIHLNEEHVYTVDGQVRLGVTSIIAPLENWFGVPASVLEYASERGRAVHLATQLLDEGDLDEDTLDPVLVPFFSAYRQFLADAAPEWKGIEERVYHPHLGYAGTLDRRGVLKAVKGSPEVIIDLKCVATLSPATGVQLAAYAAAAPATKKKRRRYALQLRSDSTYRLREYTEPTDWPVFCSLLAVHQWCRRHGKKESYT